MRHSPYRASNHKMRFRTKRIRCQLKVSESRTHFGLEILSQLIVAAADTTVSTAYFNSRLTIYIQANIAWREKKIVRRRHRARNVLGVWIFLTISVRSFLCRFFSVLFVLSSRRVFVCSIFVIDRQRLDKDMRRTRHSMHTPQRIIISVKCVHCTNRREQH